MDINVLNTEKHEVKQLFNIQKEAFQEDFNKYQDYETRPVTEAYEDFLYKINHTQHYTIYYNNQIIGGLNIIKISPRHCRVYQFSLKPSFQNKEN
ncbi:GNAT family N-acetyltransferase [Heyndrickxia sp. FSL K6-6286]|uniref:GNAT family N-acetyltransferase n=1 Tax=Heyndrickxia sp. FSL K6-6286 TaxID=2921510 RepID=UPI00217E5C43|nr:GNAT family N-acetyltransferase [Heyndrickxia oleronia]